MSPLTQADQQANPPSPERAISCVLFPDELTLVRELTLRAQERARKHDSDLQKKYSGLLTRLEYRPEDAPNEIVYLQPGDVTWLTDVLVNALLEAKR